MKRLSKEEFEDRMEALQRARDIFIKSGLTNNITKAFELYQEIFAEQERKLTISSKSEYRERTFMDNYERPKCTDCGFEMMFRVVPENEEGVKTQLVCTKCSLVLDSEKTIQEWQSLLKVRNV